ncbi:MAG: 4-hydroxy-tetrahydrodipicolinate reductase [Candidatus Anoxychlamydiales bacterium]|nr:4-hydroxy-tetrahydrodipicolinate reductase [Candidatus Anoxychlamydiales bacterium]
MKVFLFKKSGKMSKAIISISKEKGITITDDLEKADMIIDFSHFSILNDILTKALKYKIPLVIGTTGYSDEDFLKIKESSKKIPIFYSANFSIGIQLIKNFIKVYQNHLDNTFIDIIEIHHTQKKDSPSGTALSLKNEIEKYTNSKCTTHSIRSCNVIGEHKILFYKDDEKIEIKHNIENRKTFAKGSIKAAFFIKNKKNNLYNMEDLIKENI